MGFYVVSARSRASAILYPGQQLIIECNYADWGPLKVIFQTRYLDGGYDAPVPMDLWADIRGNAPDLASAVHAFVNTAVEIANIVVLGVNATLGKLELELALDASSELNEHEFLQSFMPDLPLISVPGRSIDAEAIAALVAKVNGHPERRRVMRAIAQYTEALRSWVVGNEIPCLAHLYMGVEAISKAVLRAHMGKTGKTEDELAMEWGVKSTEKWRQRRDLESECRKRLVFDGDSDTFRIARHVSDAFEHGFLDLGEIHKPARDVIVTTAAHLRRCIVDLLSLDEACRATILSSDYHTARGPLVLWRLVGGVLIGSVDRLAAAGQPYPILSWHSKLKAVTVGNDGKLGFEMDNRLDVKFGDGVQFRPEHFEVWDGSVLVQTSPPRRETIDATVERASEKRARPRRLITLVRNALLWMAAKLEA